MLIVLLISSYSLYRLYRYLHKKRATILYNAELKKHSNIDIDLSIVGKTKYCLHYANLSVVQPYTITVSGVVYTYYLNIHSNVVGIGKSLYRNDSAVPMFLEFRYSL